MMNVILACLMGSRELRGKRPGRCRGQAEALFVGAQGRLKLPGYFLIEILLVKMDLRRSSSLF